MELEKGVQRFLSPGGRIFADTCSLMHRGAHRFFREQLAPALSRNSATLIVPRGVVQELKKFKEEDSRRGMQARRGYEILIDLQSLGLLTVRGESGDRFPDQLFISLFARFMTHYDICLITQDRKLGQDVLALADMESVSRKRTLSVYAISGDGGELIPHEDEGTRSSAVPAAESSEEDSQPAGFPCAEMCRGVRDPSFPLGIRPVRFVPLADVPTVELGDGDVVFGDEMGAVGLKECIGEGGEGACFLTGGGQVCKLYRPERLSKALEEKLRMMVEYGCTTPGICWPRDLVRDSSGHFRGVLMDRAEGVDLQRAIAVRPLLERNFPNWTRRDLVRVAIDLVGKVAVLHDRNVLLGDINPRNVFVSPGRKTWLVDTDSCQVSDYPCPVGTPTFTAPEIQGRDFKDFLRTVDHEQFALATQIFMILLPGKPPYSHQGGGAPGENIRLGNFPYAVGEKRSGNVPRGPWRYIFSNLPRAIKDAFEAVFNHGQRYSAREWLELLRDYLEGLESGFLCDELFPKDLKLIEPVELCCPSCGKTFLASGPMVEHLHSIGRDCYCNECRQEILVECDRCHDRFGMPRFLLNELGQKGRSHYCPACREPEVFRCSCCGREYTVPRFLGDNIRKGLMQPLCPDCRSSSRTQAMKLDKEVAEVIFGEMRKR